MKIIPRFTYQRERKIHWKNHLQKRLINPAINLTLFCYIFVLALPVQIYDLIFPKSVYSRFTVADFSTSRLTENTSNTINRTVF